jgi:hypothetical protein
MSQEWKLNYVRPRTRERPPAARSLRGFVRNAFVASTSLAVLAVLVIFVLASPSSKLTAKVGPVLPRPGNQAVVEGRVLTAGGGGLEGAEVAVLRTGGKRETASSGADGTFRVFLSGGCATYTVLVRAKASGDDVKTASRARLCPGDSLPVDARVKTYGHYLWVPGPR